MSYKVVGKISKPLQQQFTDVDSAFAELYSNLSVELIALIQEMKDSGKIESDNFELNENGELIHTRVYSDSEDFYTLSNNKEYFKHRFSLMDKGWSAELIKQIEI